MAIEGGKGRTLETGDKRQERWDSRHPSGPRRKILHVEETQLPKRLRSNEMTAPNLYRFRLILTLTLTLTFSRSEHHLDNYNHEKDQQLTYITI